MKERIQNDWQFLLISVTTTIAGLNFIINPNLLDDKSAYAFIVNVIDDLAFSIPMLSIGIIGIVVWGLNKKEVRSFLLVGFQFIWTTLLLAYFWRALNGFPNTSWILCLNLNIAIFMVAWRGDFVGK